MENKVEVAQEYGLQQLQRSQNTHLFLNVLAAIATLLEITHVEPSPCHQRNNLK